MAGVLVLTVVAFLALVAIVVYVAREETRRRREADREQIDQP